jgi:hypothetical protein
MVLLLTIFLNFVALAIAGDWAFRRREDFIGLAQLIMIGVVLTFPISWAYAAWGFWSAGEYLNDAYVVFWSLAMVALVAGAIFGPALFYKYRNSQNGVAK